MKDSPQIAYVLHPFLKKGNVGNLRQPQDRLDEAVGLAQAIDLEVVDQKIISLSSIRPSSFFGKGKVEEIGEEVASLEHPLVIVDTELTPIQQRNLEKEWKCKVIDRTALILEIFASRAQTKEGKLQVELAQLSYQKSRLVRSWTHLERQRGGAGFMGGPGETQIEADRRLINDRITKIKRQLEKVVKTRELHRKLRHKVPYPVVALAGYTNAGKSTLFNRLTGAEVTAEDKLFATLDPTMRAIKLPSGNVVILSDTVGFVSDLPHELVAAFRATLEEVVEADIILHVRDIAHPDTEHQKKDVEAVLKQLLSQDEMASDLLVEVLNKIDLLDADERQAWLEKGEGDSTIIAVSALTGEGEKNLLSRLDQLLTERFNRKEEVFLDLANGRALSWLHEHATVQELDAKEDRMRVVVDITPANYARFCKMFGEKPAA